MIVKALDFKVLPILIPNMMNVWMVVHLIYVRGDIESFWCPIIVFLHTSIFYSVMGLNDPNNEIIFSVKSKHQSYIYITGFDTYAYA